MPENIRALVVVLAAALLAFYIAKKLTFSVVIGREFDKWRNAWFAATTVGFLSDSFFVFAAVLVGISVYVYKTRVAVIGAFFVLLFTMPLVDATVGIFGAIQSLITLNIERVLAITLLLPVLITNTGSLRSHNRNAAVVDRLVVLFCLLVTVLEFRKTELTSVMRAGVQLSLDTLIPYFAISRGVTSIQDYKKILAAFVIAVLPLSLVAIVATIKGWPIYNSVILNWGGVTNYTAREGMLRGSASSGPIVSGFLFMIGLGCLLPFSESIRSAARYVLIGRTVLAAGLAATLSRGPWVGTAALFISYVFMRAWPLAKLVKYLVFAGIAVLPLLLLPGGQRILDFLPFIGSVETGNVDYRARVLQNSITIMQKNLWLGSADYLATPEMQQLKQGQGIIDIVNTYLNIGLDNGIIGLSIFIGIFSAALIGLWRIVRSNNPEDDAYRPYAAAGAATLVAILVTIGTVSSVEFIPYVYWSFAGLCVSLIRIAERNRLERLLAARTSGNTPIDQIV